MPNRPKTPLLVYTCTYPKLNPSSGANKSDHLIKKNLNVFLYVKTWRNPIESTMTKKIKKGRIYLYSIYSYLYSRIITIVNWEQKYAQNGYDYKDSIK